MVRHGVLVTIAVLLPPCLARVATFSVVERGVSAVLIADEFGMAAGGYINFDVAIDEESGNNSLWNGYVHDASSKAVDSDLIVQ